jgi:hypothetical protein
MNTLRLAWLRIQLWKLRADCDFLAHQIETMRSDLNEMRQQAQDLDVFILTKGTI